jgi:helix-turn-helix protein
MKEAPVKVDHNGSWVVVKLGIGEDRIVIPTPLNQEILFTSIVDLAETRSTLIITVKSPKELVFRIKSVDKVLKILKRLILNSCDAYRLRAYFKAPAIRGGVMIQEARWEKGNIVIVRTGIWFINPAKQIFVSLLDVTAIEMIKTEVKGKSADVIRIDYTERGEVVSSKILCPVSTLQDLYRFLKGGNTEMEEKGIEFDATDKQVAMLVHSGVDSQSIENMLNIPHEQLDSIYDKFLGFEIAEVLITRREIKLNPKGVKNISIAIKTRLK